MRLNRGADEFVRLGRRDHRDQPAGTQRQCEPSQTSDRGRSAGDGRVRALCPRRRIAVSVGADGDRQGRAYRGTEVSSALDGLAHAGFVQASTLYDYAEAVFAAAKTSMASLVRAQD